MAYCANRGPGTPTNAKFCSTCGSAITATSEKRHQEYDGTVHKCPHCGETLGSFLGKCPSCGLEARGLEASSSLNEFAVKLGAADSVEERISLIQAFPIPNSREDIFEFLILASSNIEFDTFNALKSNGFSSDDKKLSKAWATKFEQVYAKATLVLRADEHFGYVEQLHQQISRKICFAKRGFLRFLIVWLAAMAGFISLCFLMSALEFD